MNYVYSFIAIVFYTLFLYLALRKIFKRALELIDKEINGLKSALEKEREDLDNLI